MALARAHVWNVGDLLKAADLNGEFDNILLNPVALVSPTTGAINFNLQSHAGLLPSAITTTSAASAGQALIYNGVSTTVVFGTPSVSSTNFLTSANGSTGQVFAVTSSNTAPSFRVLPIDGGLSTTVPTGGMTYYISTGSTALLGLTIGTSGQVLTVTTSGVPSWATPAAAGGGGGGAPSTATDIVNFRDDFLTLYSTNPMAGYVATTSSLAASITGSLTNGVWGDLGIGVSAPLLLAQHNLYTGQLAVLSTTAVGSMATLKYYNPTLGTLSSAAGIVSTSRTRYDIRMAQHTTGAAKVMVGFGSTSLTVVRTTAAATPGIYLFFNSSGPSNVFAVSFTSSAEVGQVDLGVTATAMRTYTLVITSSAVAASVGGALIGSIGSSAISGQGLSQEVNIASGGATAGAGVIIDYIDIQTTAANRG